ncbi:hypothetical protein F5X96DRAFT_650876 [Biscogniauxia mediterranea]|nr:hypothetical protein F5X96DRAFT_650876 [Biscogniauxia mediterranea]
MNFAGGLVGRYLFTYLFIYVAIYIYICIQNESRKRSKKKKRSYSYLHMNPFFPLCFSFLLFCFVFAADSRGPRYPSSTSLHKDDPAKADYCTKKAIWQKWPVELYRGSYDGD